MSKYITQNTNKYTCNFSFIPYIPEVTEVLMLSPGQAINYESIGYILQQYRIGYF